jgi:hypothetical protein
MAMVQFQLRSMAAVGVGIALFAVSPLVRALTFPQDPQWAPLTCNGHPLTDAVGEIQPPAVDAVGDASNPAAYVFTDGSALFLRLRMNADIRQNATAYLPYGWACLIRTSSTATTYLAWDGINGFANPTDVELVQNTVVQPGSPTRDPADTVIATYPVNVNARVTAAGSNFGGNPDYFVDWAVAMSDLGKVGISSSTPLTFICGTALTQHTLDGDLIGDETGCADGATDVVVCNGGSCSPCNTATACGPACTPCSGATPICNPATGCTGSCTSNTQCSGSTPFCDTTRGLCVGCTSNANCGGGTYCDTASGACLACPAGQSTCTGPGTGGGGNVLANGSIEGGSCACDVVGGSAGGGTLGGLAFFLAATLRVVRRRRMVCIISARPREAASPPAQAC